MKDEENESKNDCKEMNGNSVKTIIKKGKYNDEMDETKTQKKHENEEIIKSVDEDFEELDNFEKKKVKSDPLNKRNSQNRKEKKRNESFEDNQSSPEKKHKKIYNITTDSLEEEKKNQNKKIRDKLNCSNDFENEKNLNSHKIKQNKIEIFKKKLDDNYNKAIYDEENQDENKNEYTSQMSFSTKSSKAIKRKDNKEIKQKEELKDEDSSSDDYYNKRPQCPPLQVNKSNLLQKKENNTNIQKTNEVELSKTQKCSETNTKQGTVNKTLEQQEILKEKNTVNQINDKIEIQLFFTNSTSESKPMEYSFSNSFTIYRDCNLSNDNIYLEDSTASRNHARIILLEGRGFFLQDRGSSNFTYLKVNEKSKPPLEIGMELMIGFSLIKIKDIKLCSDSSEEPSDKKYQVVIDAYPKYFYNRNVQKNEMTFFIRNELFFGSGPIVKKENKNHNNYEKELHLKEDDEEKFHFDGDEKIGETHLIFHLNDKDHIIFEAKGPTYWFFNKNLIFSLV